MVDESALALEEAIQRIPEENESDEDSPDDTMTVFNGKEPGEEQVMVTTEHRSLPGHYPTTLGRPGRGGGDREKPGQVSLRQVLESDRDFTLFRRFLKDQCITRNLNFWLACEGYRSSDPSKRLELARAIYVKFLKSTAPSHVSIFNQTRRKIQIALRLNLQPGQDLFDLAQEEVLVMMEQNELRQFLCSDVFSDCISQAGSEMLYAGGMPLCFQPASYGGGSLHSGSGGDSTSVTSYTSADSDMVARTQVLCVPPHTRLHAFSSSFRNAHSDTENSSRTHHPPASIVHLSRNRTLNQQQFYETLYERLVAVQSDRVALKKRASNIAREAGKTYPEIMSQEWYDAPEARKYVCFSDKGSGSQQQCPPSVEHSVSPVGGEGSTHKPQSHIVNQAAKEVQEAMKDLDITRQVSKKRTSSVLSSSPSSYISDSGVSESWMPSNGGASLLTSDDPGRGRVHDYLQKQNQYSSTLSERDAQVQAVATLFINHSTHPDEVNPMRRGHPQVVQNFAGRRGAYSGDDSSSCFTAASHSSSEFFIPRRAHPLYTDSGSSLQQPNRYPRKLTHPRRSQAGQPTQRFLTPQQQSLHSSRAMSPAVPLQSSAARDLLVVYTMDGQSAPAPLAKRVPLVSMTLADFKEKVFARKGSYRFFFKSYCDGMELMVEITEEGQSLPVYDGKVVGHVERVEVSET